MSEQTLQDTDRQPPATPPSGDDGLIRLAILAVGGQGGGVLAGWIEATARSQGFACQTTSVAGVAQRTGATIYYIEMAPAKPDRSPVFSLAPAPGDVDIVIGAELMEAGRAIQRGFVTPGRTVLIASAHRALAVSEKIVPGDGTAPARAVLDAARQAAERLILFDMEAVAAGAGSVISAALFGALAGSGALPFPRGAFERAIRDSGKGVDASLAAFDAAFARAAEGEVSLPGPDTGAVADAADDTPPSPDAPPATPRIQGPPRLMRRWQALTARLDSLPAPVRRMAGPGLARVVDFQGPAWGESYLDRLDRVLALDGAERGWRLTTEAARHIANAMTWGDVIAVADRKTRAGRLERIARQMQVGDRSWHLTEYLHPRAEELVGLLPAGPGAWLMRRPRAMAWIERRLGRGRRIRSLRLPGFLALYLLGGLRWYRPLTLRHRIETAHLDAWLDRALAAAGRDYDLGVELIRCRRLIKGYADTHARGLSRFDRVLEGARLVEGRADAADWVRRLREAALSDHRGEALEGALATIRSFAAPGKAG